MKAHNIILRPDRLDLPLPTATVGKESSAVFIIVGDIPDDIPSMTVKISKANGELVTAAATEVTGSSARCFRCYLSPFHFPNANDGLFYHVFGTDTGGNPRWLGSGSLRVLEKPSGAGSAPDIVPPDTYIRNPATGLYHKLTATVDEDGNLALDLADEGVER